MFLKTMKIYKSGNKNIKYRNENFKNRKAKIFFDFYFFIYLHNFFVLEINKKNDYP
jgi:hypothetical protein